jgi:hypothetical protein
VITPQSAVQACKDIEQLLMAMPIEELRKAHQQMAIEAHNADVDAKKAEKNTEKTRMRKYLKRVHAEKPGMPYAGKRHVAYLHPSQHHDLRG